MSVEPSPPQDADEIRSVSDLLDALQPIVADGQEYWYRGHRDSTWNLEPAVFRNPKHRAAEKSMLDRFRQEAAVAGLPHALDEWGWVAFAQHHGLYTRLLDWSQSPLVGLYFACERGRVTKVDEPEADGEFLLIDPRSVNREAGDAAGHPKLLRDGTYDNYRPGNDAPEWGFPRAVIAPMSFDRIRFQTGTFTVSQNQPSGTGSPGLEAASSLRRFTIPSEAKQALRDQLETLGYSEVTIYRDLDRIANRIRSVAERAVS